MSSRLSPFPGSMTVRASIVPGPSDTGDFNTGNRPGAAVAMSSRTPRPLRCLQEDPRPSADQPWPDPTTALDILADSGAVEQLEQSQSTRDPESTKTIVPPILPNQMAGLGSPTTSPKSRSR